MTISSDLTVVNCSVHFGCCTVLAQFSWGLLKHEYHSLVTPPYVTTLASTPLQDLHSLQEAHSAMTRQIQRTFDVEALQSHSPHRTTKYIP